MNAADFNISVKDQLNLCEDILSRKASEYAVDEDRLHNFKVAAELEGIPSQTALAGMMSKHTVSVYDMCMTGKRYPIELWQEKITDSINYLLLLNALIREQEDEYERDRKRKDL